MNQIKPLGPRSAEEAECRWFYGGGLHRWLVREGEVDGSFLLFEDTVEPGKATPLHTHPDADETFYLLDGSILLAPRRDRARAARPVEWPSIPRGVPHAFMAQSDGARMLCLHTPGGGEDFYRTASEPAVDGRASRCRSTSSGSSRPPATDHEDRGRVRDPRWPPSRLLSRSVVVQPPQQVVPRGGVHRAVPLGEVVGDLASVVGGLVAAVLHLGPHALQVQAQAADAGELPAVTLVRGARGDAGGVGRLEVTELRGQDRCLLVRVVDDLGATQQLDGGVVRRGHAVRRVGAGVGVPLRLDVGVVAGEREYDVRVGRERAARPGWAGRGGAARSSRRRTGSGSVRRPGSRRRDRR